jgi:anti-sigma regulatory factor (Ser/Thr protein kinase)
MTAYVKEPHCELSFSPNVELIAIVRRFVSAFYDLILQDKDTASRLAMATHELLENASKYASDGETTLRIEVVAGGTGVRILLWNFAARDRIDDLAARFAEMAEAPDAAAYYQRLMERSMKMTEGSGLGLARIRAEAEMSLACRVDGERICIVADTRIGGATEVSP